MSTNYYLMTQSKELVKKYFPNEYELVDEPYLGYKIHIGKRSAGWMPLFQRHDKAYKSVAEMINLITTHEKKFEIFDEYGEKLTIEKLKRELIDWGKNQKIRYMKYIPEGVSNGFGGKQQLVDSTEDSYDITIPYDHVEYEKLDPYDHNNFWRSDEPFYTNDKDGYNFVKGDFC